MKKNYVIALTAALLLAACGQKPRRQRHYNPTCKDSNSRIISEINKDFSGIVEAVDYVKLAFQRERTRLSTCRSSKERK